MNRRLVKLIKATICCAAIGAIPCVADGNTLSSSAHAAHAHSFAVLH
jgi:hypothetical protein